MKDHTLYTISEVGKVFGFSPEWIRWREIEGRFRYLDGKHIEPLRTKPASDTSHGDRRYNLQLMAQMAQSLEREGKITSAHSDAILEVIKALKAVNKFPIRKKK